MPAILPATSHSINHQNSIHNIYFIFAPAYRHITSPTIAKIIIVPRSGINKNIKKKNAFNTMNDMKNSLVFTLLRFLISHHHKKSTYPNLKNSAGCILGSKGILIHPLAPLYTTPIHGKNTAN